MALGIINFKQNIAQHFKTKLDALVTAGNILRIRKTAVLNALKPTAMGHTKSYKKGNKCVLGLTIPE